MYEYEFARVDFGPMTIGLRDEITDMAADGWRYSGWLPVAQSREGLTLVADLVFERELR